MVSVYDLEFIDVVIGAGLSDGINISCGLTSLTMEIDLYSC